MAADWGGHETLGGFSVDVILGSDVFYSSEGSHIVVLHSLNSALC
jgi:hypothetical protein